MKTFLASITALAINSYLFALQDISCVDISDTKNDISTKVYNNKLETTTTQSCNDNLPYLGQSFFEDANGNSAIFLPYGGTFRLNTTDSSLKFSHIYKVSTKKLYYGFDILGKTNDGLVSVLSNGEISPSIQINGIIGLQELFHQSNILDGWITVKLGYEGSSFKLFNPDTLFKDQLENIHFDSFISSLSLNMKICGNNISAISIGYQKVNNYKNLKDIEIIDQVIVENTSSNIKRVYEVKKKAKMGNYNAYYQIPILVDYYWYTAKIQRIGFYHYWRTNIGNNKVLNSIGTGFYLLKKDKPLSSIAGIVFEINDIPKLTKDIFKNVVVNFVIGYNFQKLKL